MRINYIVQRGFVLGAEGHLAIRCLFQKLLRYKRIIYLFSVWQVQIIVRAAVAL